MRYHNWEGDYALFAAGRGRRLGVWNLATGKLTGPLLEADNITFGFWNTDLDPRGQMVATGLPGGAIAIWNTASGRIERTLHVDSSSTPSVINLSPDGRRVIVCTPSGETSVLDVQTGKAIGPSFDVAPGGVHSFVNSAAIFSPDGRWIAAIEAQGTVLRDAETLARVGDFIPATAELDAVWFSADGTRVAIGTGVWDVPSGAPIADTLTHGYIRDLEFSPDGHFLRYHLTARKDGPIMAICPVPRPLPRGVPTPKWLLELATIISGRTIDDAEQCVLLPATSLPIDSVQRELASLPSDAPLAQWGQWIIDRRPDRSIAPGFSITPAEAARLAAPDTADLANP